MTPSELHHRIGHWWADGSPTPHDVFVASHTGTDPALLDRVWPLIDERPTPPTAAEIHAVIAVIRNHDHHQAQLRAAQPWRDECHRIVEKAATR